MKLYEKILQINNLSATKRLPGWVCSHQDQRIRITMGVLVPHAVQDSTGTIKYISLHPVDEQALRGVPPRAEYKVEYAPTLYVQLDGVEHELLPPAPCRDHTDINHIDIEHRDNIYRTCTSCQIFLGLIQVRHRKPDGITQTKRRSTYHWCIASNSLSCPNRPVRCTDFRAPLQIQDSGLTGTCQDGWIQK